MVPSKGLLSQGERVMENNGTRTRERGFSARPQGHDERSKANGRPLRQDAGCSHQKERPISRTKSDWMRLSTLGSKLEAVRLGRSLEASRPLMQNEPS